MKHRGIHLCILFFTTIISFILLRFSLFLCKSSEWTIIQNDKKYAIYTFYKENSHKLVIIILTNISDDFWKKPRGLDSVFLPLGCEPVGCSQLIECLLFHLCRHHFLLVLPPWLCFLSSCEYILALSGQWPWMLASVLQQHMD